MALVPCPACRHEVSAEAKSCPRCGHPIAADQETSKQVVVAKEGCFLQTLNAGCVIITIVFAVLALLTLIVICSGNK